MKTVVGAVSKPSPEELVGMYETFGDGQSKEIRHQMKDGALHTRHVQALIEHRLPFQTETIDSQIVFWAGLYSVVFDIDARKDLLALHWPEPSPDFWDVPMVKGLSEQVVQNALKAWNKFPVWSYYDDLDVAIKKNDRHPSFGTYGIRFRADPEGDDDQKSISANQHKAKNPPTNGNTILEEQVLEPMYFLKSGGRHLNETMVNHAIGSRFADGRVPRVDWRGKFYVNHGFHPADAGPGLRTRVAVLIF
ncbi:MAG: hypothetical protein NT162_00295 [Candidatus Woesebacteria bacterium]|nr:hypothetical protein [Candidatus Woesebacteria bacterium]